MQKIIYTRADGGTSVVNPFRSINDQLSDEQILQRAMKSVPPDAANVQVVDSVPTDRTFRDAWKVVPGGIEHDMEKCRDIQRERIRLARAPELASLDVAFMKALEAGDTTTQAEVVAKKQALRDLPEIVAAAKTPEDLKAMNLEALIKR